jgi:hypothetical protein
VPWTLRDVEAVLAEWTPRSSGEFVDSASQRRDALWATVRSSKGRVEPHDPRRLRRDELGERFRISCEERAVEALDKAPEPLLVHGEHSLRRSPSREPWFFLKRVLTQEREVIELALVREYVRVGVGSHAQAAPPT